MLIAITGLRGVGKSTLATALAARLDASVLHRSDIQAAHFRHIRPNHDRAREAHSFDLMCYTVEHLTEVNDDADVVLDGDYTRIDELIKLGIHSGDVGDPLVLIECVCPPELAITRLGDQNAALVYEQSRATADTIPHPKLIVDTSRPVDDCVQECLPHLTPSSPLGLPPVPPLPRPGTTTQAKPAPPKHSLGAYLLAARGAIDTAADIVQHTNAPGSPAVADAVRTFLTDSIPGIPMRHGTRTLNGEPPTHWLLNTALDAHHPSGPLGSAAIALSLVRDQCALLTVIALPHVDRYYWATADSGARRDTERLPVPEKFQLARDLAALTENDNQSGFELPAFFLAVIN